MAAREVIVEETYTLIENAYTPSIHHPRRSKREDSFDLVTALSASPQIPLHPSSPCSVHQHRLPISRAGDQLQRKENRLTRS